MQVDLRHLFACPVAGIGDGDGHFIISACRFCHGVIAEFKRGIGQAVAKGTGHRVPVSVIPCVALAQHRVLVAGFVVPIAHVNAFHIHAVFRLHVRGQNGAVFVLGGEGPGAVCLHPGSRGRRREIVLYVGVRQFTGGHVLPHQRFRHGLDAAQPYVAHPQAGVHVHSIGFSVQSHCPIVIQESCFKSGSGIEQHYDTADLSIGFQLRQFCQDSDFFSRQGQEASVVSIALLRGQVRAFAAQPADHHNGRAAGQFDGCLSICGILIPGQGVHLVHRFALPVVGDGLLGGIRGVEIPQGLIHGESHALQGRFQIGISGGVDGPGAGGTVAEIISGLKDGADAAAFRQRQGGVFVLHQHQALGLRFLADRFAVGGHTFRARMLRYEVFAHGVSAFVRHDLVRGGFQRVIQRRGVSGSHFANRRHDDGQGEEQHRQGAPHLFILLHGSFLLWQLAGGLAAFAAFVLLQDGGS